MDPTEMRSDFWLLGWILNIDSPENHFAECSVRYIYIQHWAVLGCLFGDRWRTDELWVLTVWELFAITCTSKEVIANLIRLFGWCNRRRNAFGNDFNPSQHLWFDMDENSSHFPVHYFGQCRLSWLVCCLPWSIYNDREMNFPTCGLELLWQSNSLDWMALWPHGLSDLFIFQEAERILLCKTVDLSWHLTWSKHHIRMPKYSSYYNSVRSCNTMNVRLNFGAVRVILHLRPLHSRVRSQSSLIRLLMRKESDMQFCMDVKAARSWIKRTKLHTVIAEHVPLAPIRPKRHCVVYVNFCSKTKVSDW